MDLSEKQQTAVCTLFEGHYHLGVAALCNSILAKAYTGDFYAGYRGELPPWANGATSISEDTTCYEIPGTNSKLFFVKLDTAAHLTNHKPEFLLKVLDITGAHQVAYFDPDIILKADWSYVSRWINHGIALCEDVNSPLNTTHPRRKDWDSYFAKYDRTLHHHFSEYANGGFIGLSHQHREFLKTWIEIQAEMADDFGGLNESMFTFAKSDASKTGPTYMFNKTDQDAMNIAVSALPDLPYSFSGRDAMDFATGGFLFSHSLGSPKPWEKPALVSAICGRPPSPTDKVYWKFASEPIPAFTHHTAKSKARAVRLASLLSRFYRSQ